MKKTFGILLILLGIAVGIYFGLWWAFIGGIITIIEEVRAPELNALNISLGIAKVLFANLIGYVSFLIFVIPGTHIIKDL